MSDQESGTSEGKASYSIRDTSVSPEDIVKAYPTAKLRETTNLRCWNRLNDMVYDIKWKIAVIISIYVVAFCVILRLQTKPERFRPMLFDFRIVKLICYVVYMFDTVMHIIQRLEKIIRVTTRTHPLHPLPCIVIDVISLLPMEFIADSLPSNVSPGTSEYIAPFLALNELLRIYRVPMFVWEIENRFDLILVVIYMVSMLFLIIMILHFIEFIWLQCLGRWYAKNKLSWLNYVTIAINTKDPVEWYFMTYTVVLSMFNRFYQGVVQLTNDAERITCTLVWWLGMFAEYGLFFGGLLASFITFHKLRLMYEEAEHYLNHFLRIRSVDEATCQRARAYYHMLWTDASGVKTSLLFRQLPVAMRKELLLDVYWEAFKHSHLLSARPSAVKRGLAMCMQHEYYLPGDMLYKEGEIVDKMVYIVTGVVDVLSAEDKRTPIMSFSSGTCLGETSLVYQPQCKNSVRCATICVVQILWTWDALEVLSDYPASQAELVQRLQRRLKHAMDVQRNADMFKPPRLDPLDENAFPPQEVKWVKDQWRRIHSEQKGYDDQMRLQGLGWERRRMHRPVKMEQPQQRRTSEHIFQRDVYEETIARAVHTSAFLDLMVLADDTPFEVKLVCVQTHFPWIYAPKSDFTVLWEFMLFTSVVTYECYIVPFFLGFKVDFPYWWTCWGVWCDLVIVLDLGILLHTAVKGIPETVSSVAAIVMYRLQTLEFYLKALTAVPWHWLAVWLGVSMYDAMQLRHLRLVWAMKLANMVSTRASREGGLLFMFKYAWFIATLIFWFGCFQHLFDCFHGNCSGYNWLMDFTTFRMVEGEEFDNSLMTHLMLCMMYSASCIGRFTFLLAYPCSVGDQALFMIMLALGFLCSTFWMAEYCSLLLLKNICKYRFSELIATIDYFEKRMKLPLAVHRDVAHFLSFQFESNAGASLIDEETPILPLDSAPTYLLSSLKESARDAVRQLPVFVGANEDMISEMAETLVFYEYPSNMLVTRGGEHTTAMYILRRGVCRCISHWRPDVERNMTWTLQPGDCFPLMEVLHKLPCMVSVRTESACVIAMVELHQWDEVLRRYPDEKRLFQAVVTEHAQDWHVADVPMEDPQARRAKEQRGRMLRRQLMERHAREETRTARNRSSSSDSSVDFDEPQAPHDEDAAEEERVWMERRMTRLLRRVMYRRRSYDPASSFVFWWEIVRMSVAVVASFLHPCAYGAALLSPALRVACLLFDVFGLVDVYIRLQVGYYGENGILITHPAMTAKYYAKHTMVVDLLSNFPLEWLPMNEIFRIPNYLLMRFWVRMLRILQFYRFFSFMDFLESHFSYRFRSPDLVKAIVFIYLILNFSANALLYDTCIVTPLADNTFFTHFVTTASVNCSMQRLVRGNLLANTMPNTAEMYLIQLFYLLQLYTSITDGFFDNYQMHRAPVILVFSLFAWMARFWLITTMTSILAAERWLITRSRIQLDSLVQFLHSEGVDERLIQQTLTSFDYEWRHRRGLNIPNVLQRVPPLLRGDVLLHRCRNALHFAEPLSNAHEFFLRQLSSNVQVKVFSRGRFVCRVNDVQSYVFLVDKGRLEVWGPGDTPVRRLARGALFGNLARRPYTRQSFGFVARSNLVTLSWSNFTFYRILDEFPAVRARFEEVNVGGFEFVDDVTQMLRKERLEVAEEVKTEGWTASRSNFVRKFTKAKAGRGPRRTTIKAPKCGEALQSERLHYMCDTLLYHLVVPAGVICVMFVSALPERLIPLLIIIYLCDFVYVIKIICGLALPYVDPRNSNAKAKALVIRNYLSDPFKFTVDVASIIPLEAIDWPERWLMSNRYLRLIPLTRSYVHLFNKLHVSTASRWIRCTIVSTVVVCALASLHIILRCEDHLYCEYLTDVKDVSLASREVTTSVSSVVALSLVFAMNRVSTAAYMEPPPHHVALLIYLLVITIASHGLYTSAVAFVACLVNSARKMRCDFYIFVQRMLILLRNMRVSPALKRRAMNYVNNVWRNEQGRVMPSLLDRAPADLRRDLMAVMYGAYLIADPVLGRAHADLVYQMCLYVKRYVYFWGEVVVEKDDVDGCMYILQSGGVEAIIKDQFLTEKVHFLIPEGSVFGLSSGLFEGEPHIFTYRSTTKSVILSLDRNKWWHLLDYFPSAKEDVIEYAKTIKIKY